MFRLNIDQPGKQLRLDFSEKPVLPMKARMGCLASFLVVAVLLGMLMYFKANLFPKNVLGIIITVFLISLPLLRIMVFPQKKILSFDVVSSNEQIKIEWGLPGYKPDKQQIITFSQIDFVRVSVPHGMERGKSQALTLELYLGNAETANPLLSEKIQVAGLNTDHELLDFLLRLGSILRFPYYRIDVNDPKNFEAGLTRLAGEHSQPVPMICTPANYKKGRVAEDVKAPEQVVAEFGRNAPSAGVLRASIWEPGSSIELVKRWQFLDFFLLAAGLCLLAGVAVLWMQPDWIKIFVTDNNLNTEQARVIGSLILPIGVLSLIITGFVLSSARYCCHFNLVTGQARVRLRGRWRHFDLADAEEIVLVQNTQGTELSNRSYNQAGRRSRIYWHRLEVHLRSGAACRLMIDRPAFDLDAYRQHYEELWPLTVALAKTLGIPSSLR